MQPSKRISREEGAYCSESDELSKSDVSCRDPSHAKLLFFLGGTFQIFQAVINAKFRVLARRSTEKVFAPVAWSALAR